MKKHIKLIIHGKVQGVGFRFSCLEAAYRYEIKGFVKNKSNGSVYIEAEGEEENLKAFKDWCKKGPVWARVSDIEEDQGSLKEFNSFEILR
jgi:acylphosphatase